jgi:DNA-binding CsgD family transcriptional regulator
MEFVLGHGIRHDLMARADALDAWSDRLRVVEHPDHDFGRIMLEAGDLAGARYRFNRMRDRARAAGDWNSMPYLLGHLAWLELESGNWALATEYVGEREQLHFQTEQAGALADYARQRAWFSAHLGDEAATRELAAQARSAAAPDPVGVPDARVRATVALLELSLGNAAEAHALLAPINYRRKRHFKMGEPAYARQVVCRDAEALTALGRLDEADALLGPFEQCASSLGRDIAVADAERCRALLQGARGDLAAAMVTVDRSLARWEQLGRPFEVARTLLVSGEIRRRAKQKLAARDVLVRALETFERLGAAAWAERARAELARTGMRTGDGQLTATERQVAELVAKGLSNRQVADALFMSRHTVEWHLSRIYRTLGVRSRTELARAALGASAPGLSDATSRVHHAE